MARRKWILVVDDDTPLREAWVEGLQLAGYAAVGSQDGLAAVELIRDLVPDLILLDLLMPRMSGWDFLEVMRGRPQWRRIPVLIVSGYLEDEEHALVTERLNVVGKLAKPVALDDLMAKVREVVGPSGS